MLTSVKSSSCTVTADLTVPVQHLASLFSQESNTSQRLMEIHLLMYKEHRLLTEHSRKAGDNLLVSIILYIYSQEVIFQALCHGISKIANKVKKTFLELPGKKKRIHTGKSCFHLKKISYQSLIFLSDLSCKIYIYITDDFKG